ncbi:hypothetical protein PR048_027681 [Dryococelus australis]|uniref:MADF domain-containing protein n=1 Tax=Dryococelus australis TaxID=614101 RepID=A0ABQ9GH55_9NEOP|nr:hypothetical protein PR048_027681 [Dryococelus australis]
MREKRGQHEAEPECKSGGNSRSPRKHADQSIVQHDYHMQKSGSNPIGNRTRLTLMGEYATGLTGQLPVFRRRIKGMIRIGTSGTVDWLLELLFVSSSQSLFTCHLERKIQKKKKKKLDILWYPKQPRCFNKFKKQIAWEEIPEEIGKTVEECKKKMKYLLVALRGEKNEDKQEQRFWKNAEEVYTSSWFAFDSMKFCGTRASSGLV